MIASTFGGAAVWSIGETDRASACRNSALMMSDLNIAYLAMRRPISGRWCALRPKTPLLGSSAAVLRYILIRLFGEIITRILSTLAISFAVEFGAPMRPSIRMSAANAFHAVADMVGAIFGCSETEIANRIIYLGLVGMFPAPEVGMGGVCVIVWSGCETCSYHS